MSPKLDEGIEVRPRPGDTLYSSEELAERAAARAARTPLVCRLPPGWPDQVLSEREIETLPPGMKLSAYRVLFNSPDVTTEAPTRQPWYKHLWSWLRRK